MMSGPSNEMVSSQPTQYIPSKKEIQTGSLAFIEELKKRSFKSSDEIVDYVEAENLTVNYLEHTGFKVPIIVKKPEGLGLKVPPFKSFTDLENYVGPDLVVELIDVEKQDHIYMPFKNFSTYMETDVEQRTRILNMISCECSCLKLGSFIEPPAIARKIDLVKRFWDEPKLGHTPNLPRSVEKYCLIGSKNAFTDFHIDFGGTSVWYHIVKGGKEFYLIKPTVANINLYWRWSESTNCLTTFFADQVENCYKCTLTENMTLFLPSGWIHAVLTTEDSLVFGGNYLHSLNIPRQLEIYNLEVRYKVPVKQRYPYFRELHWFAARGLCDELQNFLSEGNLPPEYLVTGLRNLLGALRTWAKVKTQKLKYYNYKVLMKELAKNLNSAEKLLIKNVPPKPQRGSTRLKRKPAFNDFVVDFTQCKKSRGKGLNIRDDKVENTNVVSDETFHQNKGETVLETRNKGIVREGTSRRCEREDHQNFETQNENDNDLNNYLGTSNSSNRILEKRKELKVVLTRIPLKSSLNNFDYRIREVPTAHQSCSNINPVHQNPSTSGFQAKTGSKFLYGKESEAGKDSVERNIDRLLKSLEGCRLTGPEDESRNIINYVRDDGEWIIPPYINSRISHPDIYPCNRCFRHDDTTICPLLEQKRRALQQVVPSTDGNLLERRHRSYLCGRCLHHHDTPICPALDDDPSVRKPVHTTEEQIAIPGPSNAGVRSPPGRFSHYILTADDNGDFNEPRTNQTHARNLVMRIPSTSTPRRRPSNNETEHISQDYEFKRITGKTDPHYLGTCTTLERHSTTYLYERDFSREDTTISPDLGQESRTSQEVVIPSTDGDLLERRRPSYPCERCFSLDASTICTDLDLSVRKPVHTPEEKTAIPGPSNAGVRCTSQRYTHYMFGSDDDGNFNDSTTDPTPHPRKLIIKLPSTSTPRRRPSNKEIEHTVTQDDEFKRITGKIDAHSTRSCTTLEGSITPEHKRPSSPEVEDAIAQDEDFLYFAPEASSGNNRRKTGGDKSWSPRSRLSEVQPKPDRTLRKNITKKYIRNMFAAESQPVQEQLQIDTSESDTVIVRKRGRPRSSSNIPKVPLAANNRAYNSLLSGTRSQGTQTSPRKKKLKTAKQRLGKILKIGKMLY